MDWDHDDRSRRERRVELDTGAKTGPGRQLELGDAQASRPPAAGPDRPAEAARPFRAPGGDVGPRHADAPPAAGARSFAGDGGPAPPRERVAGRGASSSTPAPATDELRYEGPIRFDDEPAPPASYSESGSGRTLFTTALIGGAVILIISIALYLRDEPLGMSGVAANAEPPPIEGEAAGAVLAGEPGAFDDTDPLALTDAGPSADASEGIRPVPAASDPAPVWPGDTQAAAAEPPPEPARPAPRPARETAAARPAPRPAATSAPPPSRVDDAAVASLSSGLAELVGSGRVDEAARMARERAQFAPGGSWTLQVLFACQQATVSNAFDKDAADRLMLFPVARADTSCYRLTWGVFPSRDAALAQANLVPAHFRQSERPLPIALARAAGL